MATNFEDLPNDIIYEIFEYLNICDAFEIFFYQNNRFENLFENIPFLFKFDLSLVSRKFFDAICYYLFQKNHFRIISIRLSNPLLIDYFFSFYSFREKLIRLEFLCFNGIDSNERLESLLTSLIVLPRLQSLTIMNHIENTDPSDSYRLIFGLPFLKSCILSPKRAYRNISLSLSKNEFSPIQRFSLNRHCTLNQLIHILSYLPDLHHLSCLSLSETNQSIVDINNQFPHLTHLSVKFWRISFDTLKYLSSKYLSQVELLRISTRADDHYLMAERWEHLITTEMPKLRIFDFQHYWEPIDNNQIEQRTYHTLISRFNSTFWTDHHWFFSHQHFSRGKIRDSIFYSIDPYRRNLYELHERAHNDPCLRTDRGFNFATRVNIDDYRAATNSSLQFPCATELSLWGKGARGNFSFLADLSHMFQFSKLNYLSVQCPDFGLTQLIELLNHLPNLTTLTLYSNASYLSNEQIQTIECSSMKNRISHLHVRGQCKIQQIVLILNLCPRLKSLEIDIEEDQLENIVRMLIAPKISQLTFEIAKEKSSSFFKEFDIWQRKLTSFFSRTSSKKVFNVESSTSTDFIISSSEHRLLCSLCLFNSTVLMEQKLQRFLQREKLVQDYFIRSVFNSLYLWW